MYYICNRNKQCITIKTKGKMDNYNYPMGADNENAPWNEQTNDEREFEVCITATMTKTVNVYTDDYECEYDEEFGNTEYYTGGTDWKGVLSDNGMMTPKELLSAFNEYLPVLVRHFGEMRVNGTPHESRSANEHLFRLHMIEESLKGWETSEEEYEEV